MNLRCWWFGCYQHDMDATPPEEAECARCGGYIDYGDRVGDTRHQRFLDRLSRIQRLFWPKRCTDCGRKWRKCDESIDHMPF
jgi:hypothetical protein